MHHSMVKLVSVGGRRALSSPKSPWLMSSSVSSSSSIKSPRELAVSHSTLSYTLSKLGHATHFNQPLQASTRKQTRRLFSDGRKPTHPSSTNPAPEITQNACTLQHDRSRVLLEQHQIGQLSNSDVGGTCDHSRSISHYQRQYKAAIRILGPQS